MAVRYVLRVVVGNGDYCMSSTRLTRVSARNLGSLTLLISIQVLLSGCSIQTNVTRLMSHLSPFGVWIVWGNLRICTCLAALGQYDIVPYLLWFEDSSVSCCATQTHSLSRHALASCLRTWWLNLRSRVCVYQWDDQRRLSLHNDNGRDWYCLIPVVILVNIRSLSAASCASLDYNICATFSLPVNDETDIRVTIPLNGKLSYYIPLLLGLEHLIR
jgi:hypothetical protein